MNLPERTRVTVEIYGSSYKIVGSSSEYMKKIAQYVDERMNTISKSHSRLDTPKIAVLAAVHMAEEAIQAQEVRNELKMLTGERSELKAEIIQLQESRTEQNEMLLKQQEESSIVVKEKEELQAEFMQVKAELQKKLEHTMSLLQQETQKNQQLTQNQSNQENKHKQSLQDWDKQRVQMVQTAKVEQSALQSKVTELNNERNALKASLTKSETECQTVQKSLEVQIASSRKLENEVNKLVAEVKSWKMLDETRNKEVADLEQRILHANEQNGILESGMKLLHDELSVLKEHSELELNRSRASEDELVHLQQQYEDVQNVYRDTLKRYEDVKVENLTLLEQKNKLDKLLNDIQVKVSESTRLEADRLKELEIAQQSLANWKERYSQLESKQSLWIQDEQKLKGELEIWQQEISVTEQKCEELRGEKEVVDLELLDVGESFELMAHQYRLLQVEHDMQVEQEKHLREEHIKLEEEYRKLQTEYNEWIELIEQDQD